MNKLIKKIAVGMLLICSLMALTTTSVLAFNFDISVEPKEDETIIDEDTSPLDFFDRIGDDTNLRDFDNEVGRNVVEEEGLGQLTGLLDQVINIIKWALGGIALLYAIWMGFRMITATDEADDVISETKKGFLYIVIGLFSVFVIEIFINNVFVLDDGNFLGSVDAARNSARAASAEIRGIYNLMEMFLGIVAVGVIIYNGFRLVANGGSDEVVDKAKKNIGWGIAGLVLVGISELVIKDIIFADAGSGFDVERAKQLIVQLTNFISGFIAVIAIVMFIYAGYLYIFSAVGDDNTDKVKKTIAGAIIGIIIAAGAFAIVNTLIEFEVSEAPGIIQDQVDRSLSN